MAELPFTQIANLVTTVHYQILEANWRDIQALYRLEKACFGRDAWPLLDIVAVVTLPGVVRLKAVVDDQLVGFIAGEAKPKERLGWILTLGVSPDYRRLGIGRALLLECEQRLGMPRIRLSVRRTNWPAIHLYYREGYREVDVWKHYYSDGEDALILEKIVDS